MKCPRCGLVNPAEAMRCDCGFDFISRSVEAPHFVQTLPGILKWYLAVCVILNVIESLAIAGVGDPVRRALAITFAALWAVAYWQFYRRKNWARIVLVLLTLPMGIMLGLSREAKLYCFQSKLAPAK